MKPPPRVSYDELGQMCVKEYGRHTAMCLKDDGVEEVYVPRKPSWEYPAELYWFDHEAGVEKTRKLRFVIRKESQCCVQ